MPHQDVDTLRLNGESWARPKGLETVEDLLRHLDIPLDGAGIAVAVNHEVVSRTHWSGHRLETGDHIEIIRAVQGG